MLAPGASVLLPRCLFPSFLFPRFLVSSFLFARFFPPVFLCCFCASFIFNLVVRLLCCSLFLEGRNGGGRRRHFAVSEWRRRGAVRDGVPVGRRVRTQTKRER